MSHSSNTWHFFRPSVPQVTFCDIVSYSPPIPVCSMKFFILHKSIAFSRLLWSNFIQKRQKKNRVTLWVTPFPPMCHLAKLSRNCQKCHLIFELPSMYCTILKQFLEGKEKRRKSLFSQRFRWCDLIKDRKCRQTLSGGNPIKRNLVLKWPNFWS